MPGEGAGEHCLATTCWRLQFRTVAEALSALAFVTCQQQYSRNWTGCRHCIPTATLLVSINAACYACCNCSSCACAGRSSKHAYKHICSSKTCLCMLEHQQATWPAPIAEAGAACVVALGAAPSQA